MQRPGGLHGVVHAGKQTDDGAEGDVHAGLDDLSGDAQDFRPALSALFQCLLHPRDDRLSMGLAHGGGEVEAGNAVLPQILIQEAGLLFGVADYQQTGDAVQDLPGKVRDFFQPPRPGVYDMCPPERGQRAGS